MTQQAEILKIGRELEEIRQKRPEVYDLIRDALALPDDKRAEFERQIMPILKKYMN